MLSLDEVIERLKDRNLKSVSIGADVGYLSLLKLVKYKSEKVEYLTVRKLSDYLERNL